jgi:hypothetical protein
MEPEVYWEMFCATGDPLLYMLYRSTGGTEEPEHDESKS